MADAREIVARAIRKHVEQHGVLPITALADAAIAAYHPIAMEMAAGVAQRYLAADAHNVAMPMLRERYGDESCEHASEHLRMASESVPAAIRAITPPLGAAMEEGK